MKRWTVELISLAATTATEEFDALCFDFGIELDEDTTDDVMAARKKGGKEAAEAGEPELKIELPANRYDLLCLEGLARGLRQFLGKENPPTFKLSNPANMVECTVEESVRDGTADHLPAGRCTDPF